MSQSACSSLMVNHRARSGFVVEKHVKEKMLKGEKNIQPTFSGIVIR